MIIRDFILGEQDGFRPVFMSSVHELAGGFYSKTQLEAWAPLTYDAQLWAEKITAFFKAWIFYCEAPDGDA